MSVVNVKVAFIQPEYQNLKEWMQDNKNVYIGRKGIVFVDGKRFPNECSQWANPYKVGKDGTRQEVIQKYQNHLKQKAKNDPNFEEKLSKLKGKILGCWCKPEQCHGDILLQMINKIK